MARFFSQLGRDHWLIWLFFLLIPGIILCLGLPIYNYTFHGHIWNWWILLGVLFMFYAIFICVLPYDVPENHWGVVITPEGPSEFVERQGLHCKVLPIFRYCLIPAYPLTIVYYVEDDITSKDGKKISASEVRVVFRLNENQAFLWTTLNALDKYSRKLNLNPIFNHMISDLKTAYSETIGRMKCDDITGSRNYFKNEILKRFNEKVGRNIGENSLTILSINIVDLATPTKEKVLDEFPDEKFEKAEKAVGEFLKALKAHIPQEVWNNLDGSWLADSAQDVYNLILGATKNKEGETVIPYITRGHGSKKKK